MDPLLELFKKRKKDDNLSDFSDVKKVVSESEFSKCKKDFEDIVKFAEGVIKKEFDGLTLNPETQIKTTEGKNGITEYNYRVFLIDIEDNFDKFQKNTRNKKIIGLDFDDVDGEDLYKELEKRLLNPFKTKGFKFEDYTYGVMEKDHDLMDEFSVYINDDYEDMIIRMKVYVQGTVTESTVIEDMDNVESLEEKFFKRKKDLKSQEREKRELEKPLPTKVNGKQYDVKEVKKDIKSIINFTKKELDKYPEVKNKGLSMNSFFMAFYGVDDDYEGNDDDLEFFKSGEDFSIMYLDLWKYKDVNPRIWYNENVDEHPVFNVYLDIVKSLSEHLKSNYKGKFKVADYGGDWDTGDLAVELK